MLNIEKTNIQIKNAKIKSHNIAMICYYFSKDYTAIQTASLIGCSRQTVNHYYKIFRTKILEQNNLENFRKNKFLENQNLLEIKHINIYKHNIFYVQTIYGIFVLNNQNNIDLKLKDFIKDNLEVSLPKHKKANCARVLHNKQNDTYLISAYLKSDNILEEFLLSRLKKFRGINKNNFYSHLNESIFRYNNKNKNLYTKILETLN